MADDALRALVTAVGAFAIRDRRLRRAQLEIERRLERGSLKPHHVRAYLATVRKHFTPFEREATSQLSYVDRELARLYQRQFNLTAERGVAARRVELVQGVLQAVAEISTP